MEPLRRAFVGPAQLRKGNDMTIRKSGNAHWEGDLKTGTGHLSTQSGALTEQPYGFNTRFEGKAGTNPEELVGAAHASCFAMALSMILGEEGITPEAIDAKATVTLAEKDGDFAVTASHLDVTIKAEGAQEATVLNCAEAAKENCPISKLLDAEITMDAKARVRGHS